MPEIIKMETSAETILDLQNLTESWCGIIEEGEDD